MFGLWVYEFCSIIFGILQNFRHQNYSQTKKKSRKRKQNSDAPEPQDVICGSPPLSINSSNPDLSIVNDSASKMFRTSAAVANFACDDGNNMESLGAECEYQSSNTSMGDKLKVWVA